MTLLILANTCIGSLLHIRQNNKLKNYANQCDKSVNGILEILIGILPTTLKFQVVLGP